MNTNIILPSNIGDNLLLLLLVVIGAVYSLILIFTNKKSSRHRGLIALIKAFGGKVK